MSGVRHLQIGAQCGAATARWRALALGAALVGLGGCAARLPPPPTVTTPRFPNFVFPAVPAAYAGTAAAGSVERAWRFLQVGDLGEARRGFDATLRRQDDFYPASVGLGYVDLAERSYQSAIGRFAGTLDRVPSYVPALVGRGEALLATDREADALESFEAALAVDPSLAAVRRRVGVLRFRSLQAYVAAARQAAAGGRTAEARRRYDQALDASPESAFLHRELADLERRAGNLGEALAQARRATELDSTDAAAFEVLGDVEEARGSFDAAVTAFERASDLAQTPSRAAKLAAARERAEYARLPAEYRAIAAAPAITRGGLAALIGVRLGRLIEGAPRTNPALITDTREHWAAPWIMAVANAGVMEVYANHTFQPDLEVRRGELGRVVSRLLDLVAQRDPSITPRWARARVQFSDLGPSHLSYAAASRAVAAGILQPLEDDRFGLAEPVSGAAAVAAVARLEALAERPARRSRRR